MFTISTFCRNELKKKKKKLIQMLIRIQLRQIFIKPHQRENRTNINNTSKLILKDSIFCDHSNNYNGNKGSFPRALSGLCKAMEIHTTN